MTHSPALQKVPPTVVSLADHEQHARQQLDDNAWAYFSGGAADEITLRANRSAWDALPLWPRVLRPLAGGHTRIELLGRTWAHPVLLAPVAFQRLAHPDGELASAYAAAALGAGLVLSTQASVALETIAQVVLADPGRGPLWFQLYLQHDRGFTRELVQRAEAAGYEALVLTVDAPTSGVRDRERRAGFRLPPGVGPVNLAGLQAPAAAELRPGQSALFDGLLHHAPSLLAFTNPSLNSYHRLVPGFEAPVNLVYSARNRSAAIRIPLAGTSPAAKRIEFRAPDPSCNPFLAFSAQLMAGLDGILNHIEPPEPVDKDLYELPPEEHAGIKQVPSSLAEAMDALEEDHDFLTAGDVFTDDLIETWIGLKRDEIDQARLAPTPLEYELYFHI